VEVVGQLVGLHADRRRLNGVDRGVKAFEREAAQRSWEGLSEQGVEMPPELDRTPDAILPETGLALVQPQ
jgi:hypothetical protein